MQVQEVAAEGLRREFKVTIAASEIDEKVDARIAKMSKTAKMPGFRPGKVPAKLLKRQYGRSVMGEVLEQAVEDGSKQAIDDNNLKPALRPKIEVTSFDQGKDLEFKIDLEVLPEVPEVDIKAIELSRPVTPVEEARIDETIERLAQSQAKYSPVEEPRPAASGDQVEIDFKGMVDGEAFEGGSAEGYTLVLGSGSMIPGFEDGIIGMSAGEEKTIDVTFPEAYGNADLAGKAAQFAITMREIRSGEKVEIDDEFAKTLGADTVDELRKRVRERFERDYNSMSRARVKRALLDVLAERYVFDVPQGMVDLEFEAIWKQLEAEMERSKESFGGDGGQTEDEARAEYRAIAERRVRLGLVLSDIGTKNDVTVDQQELQAELISQARQYPGKEQEVFDYFRNNQGALEQLRAPLFEDKVVDFVLELANVTDKPVSVEELMREPDEEEVEGKGKDGEKPAADAD